MDHIAVLDFDRMASLILGQQHLVQLLAWPNADDSALRFRRECECHVDDAHARDTRHEDLAASHPPQRRDDERHRLLERDPETGHSLVGDRDKTG